MKRARVPLVTPTYRVTRSLSFSLFILFALFRSFRGHGTHINHRHFNIGWRTIPPPPPPRYSTKLCRESSTSNRPRPPTPGFYTGILLIRQYPPLMSERPPPPMHTTTFNASPQLRKSPWRNVHRLALTRRISRAALCVRDGDRERWCVSPIAPGVLLNLWHCRRDLRNFRSEERRRNANSIFLALAEKRQ